MKKVLVIGCNSFSGSNFVSFLLDNNYKVYGVSRTSKINKIYLKYKKNENLKNFFFYKINLNKQQDLSKIVTLIKKLKISYIVNFAAQGMVNESWESPLDWYKTNVMSSVELVEKIKKFKFIKKFLQISTPEVYGDKRGIINENSNFQPSTPYAVSRAAFDFHLLNLQKNFNFPVVISRAANVYGPGQALYRIIPKTIIYLNKKKKIILDGLGSTLRSFIYIDEVVEAYYLILKKGKNGNTYIVSDNKFITIKKLVKKIAHMKKKNFNRCVVLKEKDRVGKDKMYKISNHKLKTQIKFKFKINLEKGLKIVDKWIANNINSIKKEKTSYTHKK
jgi:dTDP-glucose 4,6-dehydratase